MSSVYGNMQTVRHICYASQDASNLEVEVKEDTESYTSCILELFVNGIVEGIDYVLMVTGNNFVVNTLYALNAMTEC
jgi:hypothetical protein